MLIYTLLITDVNPATEALKKSGDISLYLTIVAITGLVGALTFIFKMLDGAKKKHIDFLVLVNQKKDEEIERWKSQYQTSVQDHLISIKDSARTIREMDKENIKTLQHLSSLLDNINASGLKLNDVLLDTKEQLKTHISTSTDKILLRLNV